MVEFAINDEASEKVWSGRAAGSTTSIATCPTISLRLGCSMDARSSAHALANSLTQPLCLLSHQVSYASPQRRTYEQMLRRMLQRPSQPTLVLLQYYPWMRSFGDGVTQGLYYREPETEMTVLGQVSTLGSAERAFHRRCKENGQLTAPTWPAMW